MLFPVGPSAGFGASGEIVARRAIGEWISVVRGRGECTEQGRASRCCEAKRRTARKVNVHNLAEGKQLSSEFHSTDRRINFPAQPAAAALAIFGRTTFDERIPRAEANESGKKRGKQFVFVRSRRARWKKARTIRSHYYRLIVGPQLKSRAMNANYALSEKSSYVSNGTRSAAVCLGIGPVRISTGC